MFWAIPVGDWSHRNSGAQNRIKQFLNYADSDLRSCYYHVGRTNIKSIFFISDAIPITEKYIAREYIGYDNSIHIIKNPNLISELNRKLGRILAFENSKPNYFRQKITAVKTYLISLPF